ncbi:putative BOI-related E3 ubiquitin-protein ligase 3 [Tasmannia lanceolata]|uniref:putative BOI-related E3 ubiquitin-protein ligase 3 n=1 Tax=Tasmannia lanceolata TaxID=3420 RepID=UPI00406341DA
MAVQAQYPENAFRVRNGVFEEIQLQQYRENQSANLFKGYSNYSGQQILNGTVFSDPGSELTCNVSGSRKRNRDDPMPSFTDHQHQQISNQLRFVKIPKVSDPISTGLQLCNDVNRLNGSGMTSTSGRSALVSPLSQDLASFIYQQNIETDALIRLQNEKLRLGLEETRKLHCRSLLSILEQQVMKKLTEKETELENASRRNAELEEKVKQMSAENQIWFKVAKNNEAIVSNLRTSLEQVVLLQNTGLAKEGYGDSDDAQSCFYGVKDTAENDDKAILENQELKNRKSCKVCRKNDVSVLLLPCRHLCLCKECESTLDSCPICNSMKNASIQIFMS